MLITSGIIKTCYDENRRGGVKDLYVANTQQITSFTPDATDHEYTAVTMDGSAQWYKFEFERGEAEFSWEDSNENGSSQVTATVEAFIPKMEKVKAAALEALRNSCALVVIVRDFNLNAWLVGWDEFLEDQAEIKAVVNGGSGRLLTDPNRFILQLTGTQTELPRAFTGSIPTPQGVINLQD